jgi:hypothetical protein
MRFSWGRLSDVTGPLAGRRPQKHQRRVTRRFRALQLFDNSVVDASGLATPREPTRATRGGVLGSFGEGCPHQTRTLIGFVWQTPSSPDENAHWVRLANTVLTRRERSLGSFGERRLVPLGRTNHRESAQPTCCATRLRANFSGHHRLVPELRTVCGSGVDRSGPSARWILVFAAVSQRSRARP